MYTPEHYLAPQAVLSFHFVKNFDKKMPLCPKSIILSFLSGLLQQFYKDEACHVVCSVLLLIREGAWELGIQSEVLVHVIKWVELFSL